MKRRFGTAAAMAGLVIGLGAIAAGCSAADSTTSSSAGQPTLGQGQRPGTDDSAVISALAEGLGLDEDTVKAAYEEASSSLQPVGQGGTPPSGVNGTPSTDGQGGTPPSGDQTPPAESGSRGSGPGGGSSMMEQLAEAIAESLDVDADQVLSILQESMGAGQGTASPSAQPTSS